MAIIDNKGQIQIGAHTTAANNLTIDSSLNNGTFQIYTGNLGSALTTVANVSATGSVLIPGGVSYTTASSGTGTATKFIQTTYEEGTWVPNGTGITSGYTSATGTYTKIGRLVFVTGSISGTSMGVTATATFSTNLPFASTTTATGSFLTGGAGASGVCYTGTGSSINTQAAIAATSAIYFSATYATTY
jgi:hypothetical protein